MKSRRFPVEIPSRVPRLVALQVALLGLLSVVTGQPWPVAFLVADFGLRAFVTPRYSLLAAGARVLAPRLPGGAGVPVLYSPKRFAATLGFVFFTASTVFFAVPGGEVVGRVIAGMVVSLASLEALAGVCVGCHIHALLVRFGLLKAPACESCGPSLSPLRARAHEQSF